MSVTRKKTYELKDAIQKLYEIEGKSLNYISNLFGLDRKVMTDIIKNEFKFNKKPVRNTTPHVKKMINKHKDGLLNYMKNTQNRFMSPYLNKINISNSQFRTMCSNDIELEQARIVFKSKESKRKIESERIKKKIEKIEEECNKIIPGETWKDILGYEGLYSISSAGRIMSHYNNHNRIMSKRYNKVHNRFEITLVKNGKSKVHKVYRLIAHAFIENPLNLPTVKHIDDDSTNDNLDNLKWAECSDQNYHKNFILNRNKPVGYSKNGRFKKIIIDDIYEFKTIVAAAKFLNVSQTQFQRYISGETPYHRKIELIY